MPSSPGMRARRAAINTAVWALLPELVTVTRAHRGSFFFVFSALEASVRELSEGVSFGFGTGALLVVEQSGLENLPRGVSYTPSYAVHRFRRCERRTYRVPIMPVGWDSLSDELET